MTISWSSFVSPRKLKPKILCPIATDQPRHRRPLDDLLPIDVACDLDGDAIRGPSDALPRTRLACLMFRGAPEECDRGDSARAPQRSPVRGMSSLYVIGFMYAREDMINMCTYVGDTNGRLVRGHHVSAHDVVSVQRIVLSPRSDWPACAVDIVERPRDLV